MEKYLYNFIDTYDWDDTNLSFIIESNANKETMENIEAVADLIWRAEERKEIQEKLLVLYDKYFERLCGIAKAEIIEIIVKEEGYTWEKPSMIEIEW